MNGRDLIFRVSVRTDRSKLALAVGGVFGGEAGLVFSLGAFATVFQAEVFAIIASIRESNTKGYIGKTITIFTDSQAALKALESVTVRSKLILECLGCLDELVTHNWCECGQVSNRGLDGKETHSKV